MAGKLELWVWDDLPWTWNNRLPNLVCILAETKDRAWKLLEAEDKEACAEMKKDGLQPRCVETGEVFTAWDGEG